MPEADHRRPAAGLRAAVGGEPGRRSTSRTHPRGSPKRSDATGSHRQAQPRPRADHRRRRTGQAQPRAQGVPPWQRRTPPRPVAEFVLWGPPRHEAVDAWPEDKAKQWAEAAVKWTRRHFPDSPVLDAALHMDEGSPHVHVAMFPRYTDDHGETAYGWKRASTAATDRLQGRPTQANAGTQRRRGTAAVLDGDWAHGADHETAKRTP